MRISFLSMWLVCVSAAFGGACADVYSLDDYSLSGRRTAAMGADGDGGSQQKVTEIGGSDAGPACRTHADCGADGESMCIAKTGTCAPLRTAACPRVFGDTKDDSALVVGTILQPDRATGLPLEQAALLAAAELNQTHAGRPLVVVSCDESADVLPAARHLANDLRAAAIVGPTADEHVLQATQQVTARADTLLMTPTALLSSLAQLNDNGLTWRNVPSQSQRAKLVIRQINDLEGVLHATRSVSTVKLGMVYRGDAVGISDKEAIAGQLIVNGNFINDADNAGLVSMDSYAQADDKEALAAIATRYSSTFVPDILFITAAEQVEQVIAPVEQALTAARALYRPYYVLTEGAKTPSLLAAVASPRMPPDLRRRLRGIGVRPDTASAPVLTAYQRAFAERYPGDVGQPAASSAYDAMYAVAFAMAAARDVVPSGTGVARGLRALGVGNSSNVGAAGALHIGEALAAGNSVALRGTSSLMQWDANGDIAGGTVEVWCVGSSSGAPAFGGSGLTMDVQTQVIGGAYVQCQ